MKHKCSVITNAHIPATCSSHLIFCNQNHTNTMWWLGLKSPSRRNFLRFLLLPFIRTDANCHKFWGRCNSVLHNLRLPLRSASIHKPVQNTSSYRRLSKWFAGLESNTGKYVITVIRTHWAQCGTVAATAILSVRSVLVNTVSSAPCSYRQFTSF